MYKESIMNCKIIIKIILLISWMTLIFCFSNQTAGNSSKVSDGLIYKVSKIVFGEKYEKITKSKAYGTIVFVVRKSAHMFVYFVLSLIAFSLFYEFFGVSKKTIIYTIIFCFLYSITDEVHQLFVLDRSGEIRDVLIDTTSSSISALLNFFVRNKKINH